ncbi:hypothetical protein Aperf_G00000088849 [Anoplocephala perfoliata]
MRRPKRIALTIDAGNTATYSTKVIVRRGLLYLIRQIYGEIPQSVRKCLKKKSENADDEEGTEGNKTLSTEEPSEMSIQWKYLPDYNGTQSDKNSKDFETGQRWQGRMVNTEQEQSEQNYSEGQSKGSASTDQEDSTRDENGGTWNADVYDESRQENMANIGANSECSEESLKKCLLYFISQLDPEFARCIKRYTTIDLPAREVEVTKKYSIDGENEGTGTMTDEIQPKDVQGESETSDNEGECRLFIPIKRRFDEDGSGNYNVAADEGGKKLHEDLHDGDTANDGGNTEFSNGSLKESAKCVNQNNDTTSVSEDSKGDVSGCNCNAESDVSDNSPKECFLQFIEKLYPKLADCIKNSDDFKSTDFEGGENNGSGTDGDLETAESENSLKNCLFLFIQQLDPEFANCVKRALGEKVIRDVGTVMDEIANSKKTTEQLKIKRKRDGDDSKILAPTVEKIDENGTREGVGTGSENNASQGDSLYGSMVNDGSDTRSSLKECLLLFIQKLYPELAKCVNDCNNTNPTESEESETGGSDAGEAAENSGSESSLKDCLMMFIDQLYPELTKCLENCNDTKSADSEGNEIGGSGTDDESESECIEEIRNCFLNFVERLYPELADCIKNYSTNNSASSEDAESRKNSEGSENEEAGTLQVTVKASPGGANSGEDAGQKVIKKNDNEDLSEVSTCTGREVEEADKNDTFGFRDEKGGALQGYPNVSVLNDGTDSECSNGSLKECFLQFVRQLYPKLAESVNQCSETNPSGTEGSNDDRTDGSDGAETAESEISPKDCLLRFINQLYPKLAVCIKQCDEDMGSDSESNGNSSSCVSEGSETECSEEALRNCFINFVKYLYPELARCVNRCNSDDLAFPQGTENRKVAEEDEDDEGGLVQVFQSNSGKCAKHENGEENGDGDKSRPLTSTDHEVGENARGEEVGDGAKDGEKPSEVRHDEAKQESVTDVGTNTEYSDGSLKDCLLQFIQQLCPELTKCVNRYNNTRPPISEGSENIGSRAFDDVETAENESSLKDCLFLFIQQIDPEFASCIKNDLSQKNDKDGEGGTVQVVFDESYPEATNPMENTGQRESEQRKDVNTSEVSTSTDEDGDVSQIDHHESIKGSAINDEIDTECSNSSLKECFLQIVQQLYPELAKCVKKWSYTNPTESEGSEASVTDKSVETAESKSSLKVCLLRFIDQLCPELGDLIKKCNTTTSINSDGSEPGGSDADEGAESECSEETLRNCMLRFIENLCPELTNCVRHFNANHSTSFGNAEIGKVAEEGNDEEGEAAQVGLKCETMRKGNNSEENNEQEESEQNSDDHAAIPAFAGQEDDEDTAADGVNEASLVVAQDESTQPCTSTDGFQGDISEAADGIDTVCSEDIFGECFLHLIEQVDPGLANSIVQCNPPEYSSPDVGDSFDNGVILQHSNDSQNTVDNSPDVLSEEFILTDQNLPKIAVHLVGEDDKNVNNSGGECLMEESETSIDVTTVNKGESKDGAKEGSDPDNNISLHDIVTDESLSETKSSENQLFEENNSTNTEGLEGHAEGGDSQEFEVFEESQLNETLSDRYGDQTIADSVNDISENYPDRMLPRSSEVDSNDKSDKIESDHLEGDETMLSSLFEEDSLNTDKTEVEESKCSSPKSEGNVETETNETDVLHDCENILGEKEETTDDTIKEDDSPAEEDAEIAGYAQECFLTIGENLNYEVVDSLKNYIPDQASSSASFTAERETDRTDDFTGGDLKEARSEDEDEVAEDALPNVDSGSENKSGAIKSKVKSEGSVEDIEIVNEQNNVRGNNDVEKGENRGKGDVISGNGSSNESEESKDQDDLRGCLLAIAEEFYPELANCIRKCVEEEVAATDSEIDRRNMRSCLENFAAQFYPKGVLDLEKINDCGCGVENLDKMTLPTVSYIQRLILDIAQVFHPNLADRLQQYLTNN